MLDELVWSLTPSERAAMATGIRHRQLKPGRFLWTDGACGLGTMGLELGILKPLPEGAEDFQPGTARFTVEAQEANTEAYYQLMNHFQGRANIYRYAREWDDAIHEYGKDGILAILEKE